MKIFLPVFLAILAAGAILIGGSDYIMRERILRAADVSGFTRLRDSMKEFKYFEVRDDADAAKAHSLVFGNAFALDQLLAKGRLGRDYKDDLKAIMETLRGLHAKAEAQKPESHADVTDNLLSRLEKRL